MEFDVRSVEQGYEDCNPSEATVSEVRGIKSQSGAIFGNTKVDDCVLGVGHSNTLPFT